MTSITFYTLIAGSLVLLLFILSGRRIGKIWLVLWGISPVIAVYLLNPGFRVYSFHSFMHGGIVYQILNGNIPPFDPLVGGHLVHYPWGPHVVAAGISKILRVTPFYSLALMNIASLCFVIALIYKISHLLIDDERTGILAVVCSVFGVTMFIPEMLKLLPKRFPAEIRGIPILHKFITVNTLPVGLVFFLLALYAAIRLFRGSRLVSAGILLLASILGTSFFYPAFIPGIVASIAAGIIVVAVLRISGRARIDWGRVALVLVVTCLGLLVLRPYLASMGSATLSNLTIFGRRHVGGNVVKYLVITIPMLVIILINLRSLVGRLERRGLFIIAIVTLATMGSYFFIHLPLDNEYKFLLLSTVTLGILGGAALGSMLRKRSKFLVFILIALLLIPSFRIVHLRVSRGGDIASTYIEQGIDMHSANAEEDELYTWIRDNTAPNSVIIDRELEIPVLAQRQLLIAVSGTRRVGQKGFGGVNLILQFQSGYDADLLNTRRGIVDRVYADPRRLSEAQCDELRTVPGDIYIVGRTACQCGRQLRAGFSSVFTSSDSAYALYEMVLPD